ncbi:MAG TPA: SHOCT domain-containing protein [Pseudonocardiaceae bacterium]
MNGWGFALMGVGMILFWALVITGVVMLVRHLVRTGRPASPADLLAQRYARGELDDDEYQHRLELLRGEPGRRRGP